MRDARGQLLWGGLCGADCGGTGERAGGCWPQTFCSAAAGWTSALNPRGVCADPAEALDICFQ